MNTSQTNPEKSATNYQAPKVNPELTALKKRMIEIRDRIPGNATEIFVERFPKYNNHKGISKLKNALNNCIVDEEIVAGFEAIAKEYQEYLDRVQVEFGDNTIVSKNS